MQKYYSEYLLPKKETILSTAGPNPEHLPEAQASEILVLQSEGWDGVPTCVLPFTSKCEVTYRGHAHPLCCVERGAGEDLAPRQVGSGPFREVTKAVGGAHHLEAIRYSPGSGGHPPAHRVNTADTSTETPEVAFHSSCRGGMRQHCALKSIPDPISER